MFEGVLYPSRRVVKNLVERVMSCRLYCLVVYMFFVDVMSYHVVVFWVLYDVSARFVEGGDGCFGVVWFCVVEGDVFP